MAVFSIPYFQHILSSFGCFIVFSHALQVVLILLTVHSLVVGLAEDAVGLAANRALELVDLVLVDTPPSAVGSLAVETVGQSTLGLGHDTFVVGLELFFCNTL
jgi:hypothetical protein